MTDFKLIQREKAYYADSRQVAGAIGKKHFHLMRDIEKYAEILGESNFGLSEFFLKVSCNNSQNKKIPYYLITKKGCELIAHKLTGERGVQFSATYIKRFHEMESQMPNGLGKALLQGLAEIKEIKAQMTRQLASPKKSVGGNAQDFWSIRAYARLIGATLPENVSGLGQKATHYSKMHGVMIGRCFERQGAGVVNTYHVDVLRWLFGKAQGGERNA